MTRLTPVTPADRVLISELLGRGMSMREIAVVTNAPTQTELTRSIDLIEAVSPEVAGLYCAFQVGMLYGGYEGLLIGIDALSQEFFDLASK